MIDFFVHRLLKAIDYLKNRDIDGDGLLEQGYNEDWMDTLLRAGKIVYSQASWILALTNLSSLLSEIGHEDEATELTVLANKTIQAVEDKLWQEKERTCIDLQEKHPIGQDSPNALTQDVSLYLAAIKENTTRSTLNIKSNSKTDTKPEVYRSCQDNNIQRLQ